MAITKQTALSNIANTVSTPNLKLIANAAVDVYCNLSSPYLPVHPSLQALVQLVRSIVSSGDDITG